MGKVLYIYCLLRCKMLPLFGIMVVDPAKERAMSVLVVVIVVSEQIAKPGSCPFCGFDHGSRG